MTNSEHPSPPPTLTLVEKLYAVHNINSLIPEKLDLAESNYSTWSYFFKGHCSNFGVLKHIEEPVTEASTSTPPTDEWITADSIVKSWIFLTLSSTLRKRLIKANPKTAKAAWDAIETIFQDNKRTRTISLKGELRVIQMGDQTADEYFSKIEAILTLLTDLGSDMSDDDVVTYAINGLSDKYGSLAQIIAHKDPFPDLATVRSIVATEELRLRSRSSVLPTGTTLSAPQVLLAEVSSRNQTGWNIVNGTTVPQHVRCVVILDVVFVVGAMLVVSFMTPLIPQLHQASSLVNSRPNKPSAPVSRRGTNDWVILEVKCYVI
ncbi:hybrid signal transduction histidine kinase M [Tanacetum coccineum]